VLHDLPVEESSPDGGGDDQDRQREGDHAEARVVAANAGFRPQALAAEGRGLDRDR
jgi:hypothetical protein